jgi:hypothetical protein
LYIAVVYLQAIRSRDDDDNDTVVSVHPEKRFIEHQDADGNIYYEDTETGTTTWERPGNDDDVQLIIARDGSEQGEDDDSL